MFAGEERHRKVIEKIIAETKAGNIVWRERTPPFECSYVAKWQGWKIVATYFQDETSVEMARESECVGMSYRVMEGLKEAILDQVSPDWRERGRKRSRDMKRLARKCSQAKDRLINEILKL